jgi:hypothetical protein
VPLDGALPAPGGDLRRPLAELRDELLHPRAATLERLRGAIDLRGEDGHADQPNEG